MNLAQRCLFALVILFSAVSLGSCGSETDQKRPSKFVFTAIPDNDETQLRERFEPLAAYLAAELDIDVEYVPVSDYANAVNAMSTGDVFLAWFGGLSGVQARARTRGEAIAQGEEDQAFYSYFIADKALGLGLSEDFPKGIEGKTFTFGSEGSTSGRLMPEFFIRKHLAQSPKAAFKGTPGFSGSHDNTARAVAEGGFQVGALNGKTWERWEKEGKTGKAEVIWKTPTYYDYNWSVPGNIDEVYGEGFKDRVQQALLALDPKNPEHAKILGSFPRKRFIAAKNEDYRAIEDTARSLGLIEGR